MFSFLCLVNILFPLKRYTFDGSDIKNAITAVVLWYLKRERQWVKGNGVLLAT